MRQDGSRFEMMGPSPEGVLMYDAHGRMSLQIMRPDRLKFAKGNRLEGTAEENQAASAEPSPTMANTPSTKQNAR